MVSTAGWRRIPQRARHLFRRETVGHDAAAGLALAVQSVPNGLATGLLAGVSPLSGLYGYLYGTLGGSLVTATSFMPVQATAAMALIVADVNLGSRTDATQALYTLTLLTGVVMLVAGVLKAGSLLRFVPTSVMVGFISAVGVNIVISQLSDLTGYRAQGSTRIGRVVDLVIHPGRIDGPTLAVGLVTIAAILLLNRTPLRAVSLVAAVAVGSGLAALLATGGHPIARVEDLAVIPSRLPAISWPSLGDIGFLLVPAVSLAFVGLVQGAGVATAYPPPDGSRADRSRDFIGQGAGNLFSGLFQGLPVGGSMSGAGVLAAAGARTRLALVIAGLLIGVMVVGFSGAIGLVAMPALAGLLVVIGVTVVKPAQIAAVARSVPIQTITMVVTFGLTLVIPLQYAVLLGVAFAVVLHVVGLSNRMRVHRVVLDAQGHMRETQPPAAIGARDVVVLQPYGSFFFASAPVFEAQLPRVAEGTDRSVVILRLRGVDHLGLGLLDVLRRYADQLTARGSKLMIVTNEVAILDQINRSGLGDLLGEENLYRGDEWVGAAVRRAHADAEEWVKG